MKTVILEEVDEDLANDLLGDERLNGLQIGIYTESLSEMVDRIRSETRCDVLKDLRKLCGVSYGPGGFSDPFVTKGNIEAYFSN